MKVGNRYSIPFKGLKQGQHNFEFDLDKEFFEENEALEIPSGKISINVVVQKKSNFLELDVELTGKVELQCDRCLEYFHFPIKYNGRLFVKFKEEFDEPDDEVIFLSPNADILDLQQYFYDCIGLSVPIQKFHPQDESGTPTCNPEILNILQTYSYSKKNEEIDPRWSKLNDLLKDRNKSE